MPRVLALELPDKVQCKYGGSKDGIPNLADASGEQDVEIQIGVSAYCYPVDPFDQYAIAVAGKTTLTLKACVQVKDGRRLGHPRRLRPQDPQGDQ